MRKYVSSSIGVGIVAVSLIAGALWLRHDLSSRLEFRDRPFPEGFRDLVLKGGASRLDPIVGLPGPFGAREERRSRRLNTREVCDALFRDPVSPAVGDPNSSVQIAAFFDYRCPYCRTLSNILSEMQGHDLRVVYKEWPVLGDASDLAARAALAANNQGRYDAYHRRLMNSRFVPTVALVEDIAGELGMNRSQLRDDMADSRITSEIGRTRHLASDLGLSGTPVLVVGRTIIEGAVTRAQLESVVRDPDPAIPELCRPETKPFQ